MPAHELHTGWQCWRGPATTQPTAAPPLTAERRGQVAHVHVGVGGIRPVQDLQPQGQVGGHTSTENCSRTTESRSRASSTGDCGSSPPPQVMNGCHAVLCNSRLRWDATLVNACTAEPMRHPNATHATPHLRVHGHNAVRLVLRPAAAHAPCADELAVHHLHGAGAHMLTVALAGEERQHALRASSCPHERVAASACSLLECRKCWSWSKQTARTSARTKSMKPNQSRSAHLDSRLGLLPLAEAHKAVATRAAGGMVPPAQKARVASAGCAQGACCTARTRVSASVQGGRQLRYGWAPNVLGLSVLRPMLSEPNAAAAAHMTRASEQPGQEEKAACSMASVTSAAAAGGHAVLGPIGSWQARRQSSVAP